MKFDGIILDVDGTIWNTTGVVAKAWNKAIDENYPSTPHVTAEILQGQFGKTMEVIAANLFSNLEKKDQDILIGKCCVEEHIAIKNNTENITYEQVLDTIHALSKKVPMFIVSNCQSGYIELVMEKNKIVQDITDKECYGDTLKNKDENIKLLVARNNLKNPVYVGDTQGDADACKLAGVTFIWASYGFGKVSDYYAKIDSFDELISIVD